MNDTMQSLSREQLERLVVDLSKRWLAHDGLWFQAIEADRGMDEAMRYDTAAWRQFSALEARRVLDLLGLAPGGGIDALEKALGLRLYAFVNSQQVRRVDERKLVLSMTTCRVQTARQRRSLADFPCKQVGLVEYTEFARAIDPRIETRCLMCPPDPHPDDLYCIWEFKLREDNDAGGA